MEVGKELKAWLHEQSKPYGVRLDFALKVWQSLDLSYANKFEIIISWLAEMLAEPGTELFAGKLRQLFKLRAQPGLVCSETKTVFVQAVRQRVADEESLPREDGAELILDMLNFELLQDVFRAQYLLLMKSYATLFKSYELHLRRNATEVAALNLRETDFALALLQHLREYAQRAQKPELLLEAYSSTAVKPLVEMLLQLHACGLNCFAEFAGVEAQLTDKLEDGVALQRIQESQLHVRLLTLEAAVYNRRLQDRFIRIVVRKFIKSSENGTTCSLMLTEAACTLETLRKHNITLQFAMKKTGEMTGIDYMGQTLYELVKNYRKTHLREVLLLLCAALKLNPLMLEQHVYQITIWLFTMPKESEQMQLYGEYLQQLLNMFQHLSRAEQFVMNILKALREWLSSYELKQSKSKRTATVSEGSEESPAKRVRLDQRSTDEPDYMQLYLQTYSKLTAASIDESVKRNEAFDSLAESWPSETVGDAFTKLVSNLQPKPSIVIWKTLLFGLAELLQAKEGTTVLPVNRNFTIQLHAALLCQYLVGNRLMEHLAQHLEAVNKQRLQTIQVLSQFGQLLLREEHNRRNMNAFLTCVSCATSFDLMLNYYWPDGLSQATPQCLQSQLLTDDEWTLIKQRVHNFGKSACRRNLQRLELQRAESNWLMNHQESSNTSLPLELLPPKQLQRLTRTQKLQQLQYFSPTVHKAWLEDAECIELMALNAVNEYAKSLKKDKQLAQALLAQLPIDALQPATKASLNEMATQIRQKLKPLDALPLPKQLVIQLVDTLVQLPLKQLNRSIKSRLFLLIIALHWDLSSANLKKYAKQMLELLIDLLHFGKTLSICSYFPNIAELLQLLPPNNTLAWTFYETLFALCVKRQGIGMEAFMTSCSDYLGEQLTHNKNSLESSDCRLLLLSIETLSGMVGAQPKRLMQPLLQIYGQLIFHVFATNEDPAAYKQFVQETLSAYSIYLNGYLSHGTEDGKDKPIDENFKRICKIYIGHSLEMRNDYTIRLLTVAITQRLKLHLDKDEIDYSLQLFWTLIYEDIMQQGVDDNALNMNSIEQAIKLIIVNKTNEDFLLLLNTLEQSIRQVECARTPAEHNTLENLLTLIRLISKCQLSTIKGAILNERLEPILGEVTAHLPTCGDPGYRARVFRLLDAQNAVASNRGVPLTGGTLDYMLDTLLGVNIKGFLSAGGSWTDFVVIHEAMLENCSTLLRQHSVLMSDRVMQLMRLFEHLLQAIVCYRMERKQQNDLSSTELDGLTELSLKLVTLMDGIVSVQAVAFKRVAPFLLIFVIKLMVSTERPTTQFEKIKMHIMRICHDLISLCDHRSGHFILRSSCEAGSRLYQTLMKEHKKYHKFKGKV